MVDGFGFQPVYEGGQHVLRGTHAAVEDSTDEKGPAYRVMVAEGRRWHAPYVQRLREPFFRSSMWWIVNTAIVAGSGLIFWFLAARMFPVRQVGLTTAAVGAVSLVGMIGKFGMDVSILRFLPQREGPRASDYINTALSASALVSSLGAVIFLLGIPWWAKHLGVLRSETTFIIGFVAMCVAFALSGVTEAIFSTRHRNDLVVTKNAMTLVARVTSLLVIGLTTVYVARAQIFVAWALPFVLALGVSVVWLLPKAVPDLAGRIRLDPFVVREMFGSSLANSMVSFAAPLPLSIGTLIVLSEMGATASAVFYILYMIGSLAQVGALAFARQSLVEMSKQRRTTNIDITMPLIVSTLIGFAVPIFGSIVLPWFGPAYAAAAGWPLLPFAIGAPVAYFQRLRLAQFRATGQHLAMIVTVVLTITSFLVALRWGGAPVTFAGWWWLGALVIGTFVSYSIDVREAALLPTDAVDEDIEA